MTWTHRQWKNAKKSIEMIGSIEIKPVPPVGISPLNPMLEDMLEEMYESTPHRRKSGKRNSKERW